MATAVQRSSLLLGMLSRLQTAISEYRVLREVLMPHQYLWCIQGLQWIAPFNTVCLAPESVCCNQSVVNVKIAMFTQGCNVHSRGSDDVSILIETAASKNLIYSSG